MEVKNYILGEWIAGKGIEIEHQNAITGEIISSCSSADLDYEAILNYGTDKPDIRFDMKIHELNSLAKNKGFNVFDKEELIVAISVPNAASYSRKQIDSLTDWVKKPQIGANGLVWIKYESENNIKSSVDNVINLETSIILLTSFPSISKIISFCFKPPIIAGLSFCTSLIIAGVKSFPAKV